MKKIIPALVASLFIFSSALYAQDYKHCYTTEVYNQLIKDHPEISKTQSDLEQYTQQFSERISSSSHVTGTVYIIPIVFHIIHNNGPENISDSQVEDQVRILNDDYRKRSYDTASIVSAFQSIAADCEIEFRLATIDPWGNCTNGIEHVISPLTYNADDNSKLNPWPANKYLNVWTAASLANSGAAAYAYYPGTAPFGADGVIMLSNYVGSIGSGTVGRSRVLTHEIGHYLNLAHVWGSTNSPGVACGDDGVNDTPITMGWTYCNIYGATCGNAIDNVQNYMEYSYCCSMFSLGQKNRMRAALNSSTGSRNNLWTTANLNSTGTNGISQVCIPVTDFKSDHQTVCYGSVVHFFDLSWRAHPTSWLWNFPGGTPSTSTDSMPIIQYNSSGVFDVSLTTGTSAGSDSLTRTSFIRVNGAASQLIPFTESFEVAGSFPGTGGYVLNPDGGNTWQRVTNAGSTGTASIRVNNFSGNTSGEIDEYITPAFDLTGIINPVLDFKVAYAQRDVSHSDALRVYVSDDCGQTWVLRWNKSGSNLATAGIVHTNFTPNATQWRQEHIASIPFQNIPNLLFKFQNTSDAGNNVYIDDINVSGVVSGISENTNAISSFNIFPNPSSGLFYVSFKSDKTEKVKLKVTDALGREIITLLNSEKQPGEYQFSIDKKLESGIYFIILEKDGQSFTKKLLLTRD